MVLTHEVWSVQPAFKVAVAKILRKVGAHPEAGCTSGSIRVGAHPEASTI